MSTPLVQGTELLITLKRPGIPIRRFIINDLPDLALPKINSVFKDSF